MPFFGKSKWQCSFKRGWDKQKFKVLAHDKPFSAGAFRFAYHGLYTKYHGAQPHGRKAVVKKLKTFSYWDRQDWDQELRLAQKAQYLVSLWNRTRSAGNEYVVHVPEVVRIISASTAGDFQLSEWVTTEPYIEGNYKKWNSNSGWVREENLSVHAFCHWTYHHSEGKLLLCDAQGVKNGGSYTITDPAICSEFMGQYGMTDLGMPGIAQWFRHHKCNRFCDPNWIRPSTRGPYMPNMPVKKSSTYTWQSKRHS